MKLEQIEAFLAIVKYGSINKAAERIYVTQPALSHRIIELESELGGALFVRSKGQRNVRLTPLGERFLPNAEHLQSFWQKTLDTLIPSHENMISISATNSLSGTLFVDLCEKLNEIAPDVTTSLSVKNYSETYEGILSGEIDYSFLIYPRFHPNIESIPIAKEPMSFVCAANSDYPDLLTTDMLDTSMEVFLSWSQDYHYWHNHAFKNANRAMLQTRHVFVLEQFLLKFNAWCILPKAVALTLQKTGNYRICEISPTPPERNIYLAYNSAQKNPYHDLILSTIKEIIEHHKAFLPVDNI